MAHDEVRQCRINNLASINAFICTYITKKAKFASFTKIRPSQKTRLNVHGNVIHIANLLTSIGDKKLYIQINYFIYHINHKSYRHSKS